MPRLRLLLCLIFMLYFQTCAEAQPESLVILIADEISEEGDIRIATGNVEAQYGTRYMQADQVIYDQRTGKVRALGNVVITYEDGTQQYADEAEVGQALEEGYAIGFSTRLPEGGVASANIAIRQPDGIDRLEQAIYTACEICKETGSRPTWVLRARKASLNKNNDMIFYRDAILEIGGLPIIYLPYFFHPDPSAGKRSGLLVPEIGGSGRLGFIYGQPYYQVISPSADITVTPFFYTQVRPRLETEFRKRFWSGQMNIEASITYDSDFDNDGINFGDEKIRGHVFGKGEFALTDFLTWGFGVERASDDLFIRRYSIDGDREFRGLYDSQPQTLLSQIYAIGQTQNFYSETTLLAFQDLRRDNPRRPQTHAFAPITFSQYLFDLKQFGRLDVTASAALLTRDREAGRTPDINPDSHRFTASAEWKMARVLPAGFVLEPFAEVRGDYYNLDAIASGKENVSRFLASVGSSLSWPIIRTGKHADILFTPKIMGAWGPSDVNDEAIPLEDTLLAELEETRLFEANGFGNYDLYEGGGRLAAGFTGEIKLRSGQSLSAVAGRRWREFSDPNFDEASNLEGTSSDWVGGIALDLGSLLKADTRFRLDEESFALNRIDANLSTKISRLSARARYFRIDEDIRPGINQTDEGLELSANLNLTENYSVSYGQLIDLTEKINLRRQFGIAYQDDCSRFELVYMQSGFEDRTISGNNSFMFRFTLATIGEFGNRTSFINSGNN